MGHKLPYTSHMSVQLSAVICTCNRYDLAQAAIDSLLAQSLPAAQLQIIVVDNSPSNATNDAARAHLAAMAGINYYYEPVQNLSHARNVGARHATAPLVAYLDDDAIAEPGWAQAVIEAFATGGDAVLAIGGRTLPKWGAPRPPWLSDSLIGFYSVIDWPQPLAPLAEGRHIVGANISFRRNALLKTGAFPVTMGRQAHGGVLLSGEEDAVLHRLLVMGGQIWYAPDMCVQHFVPAARLTQDWLRARVAWQAVTECMMRPQQAKQRAAGFFNDKSFATNRVTRDLDQGLFADCPDAESFSQQMALIYASQVRLLLP